MRGKVLIVALLFWLGMFGAAEASVRINEIAWMGTDVSSTNEWLELYNDAGAAVDLSGWHIEADDGSPNIALSGVIAPGGYFLIERTNDSTVPDVAADLVTAFGNGLSNSGETLKIKDGGGAVIDVVVGGSNWENTGGDNSTKETAQRTTNSWITGVGTPRAANISSGEVAGATDGGSTATTSTTNNTGSTGNTGSTNTTSGGGVSGSSAASKPSIYPRKTISAFAGDDQQAFVGFPVILSGKGLGYYDEALTNATYRWNFGDGAVGEGASATHVYRFAGDYVVTLDVVWAGVKATDRLSVSVTAPDILIARQVAGSEGFVELTNHSSREIDIAGWKLHVVAAPGQEGVNSEFIFPPNTVLLPGKSAIFPNEITGITVERSQMELLRPNELHQPVKQEMPPQGEVKAASITVPPKTSPKLGAVATTRTSAPLSLATNGLQENLRKVEGTSTAAATVLWQHEGAKYANTAGFLGYDTSTVRSAFFVILGIILVVLAWFIIVRSRVDEATAADEYAIIEDIIEGKDDHDMTK